MWWHKIWSDYWARKCKVYILQALLQSGIKQSTTPTNGISLHRPRLMVPQPKQCRFLLSGFNWGSTLALITLFHLSRSLVQAGKAQGGRGNSLLYKCFWKCWSCPTTVNIEVVLLHRVYGPINELHEVSWSNGESPYKTPLPTNPFNLFPTMCNKRNSSMGENSTYYTRHIHL